MLHTIPSCRVCGRRLLALTCSRCCCCQFTPPVPVCCSGVGLIIRNENASSSDWLKPRTRVSCWAYSRKRLKSSSRNDLHEVGMMSFKIFISICLTWSATSHPPFFALYLAKFGSQMVPNTLSGFSLRFPFTPLEQVAPRTPPKENPGAIRFTWTRVTVSRNGFFSV